MPGEDLEVRPGLVIPAAELTESASRAGGPGGQHVNKVSTRVTLRWCPSESAALTPGLRARLLRRLSTRLTRGGDLIVHARRHRSRSRNRELARERLAEVICEALVTRRSRVATKPGKRAKARRIEGKRHRSQVKRTRRRPGSEE